MHTNEQAPDIVYVDGCIKWDFSAPGLFKNAEDIAAYGVKSIFARSGGVLLV